MGDTLESERSSLPVHKLTPEEYLAIERDAATKSEYYQGEMFAMSGASARHDDIAENVKAALRQRLKAFPCKVNSGDLRLRVSPTGLYTYPDISITCGPRRFADSEPDTLTNPTVIIEVLSDSTRDYDLGRKFDHYRTIESLKEYITVEQDSARVTHRVRQSADTWTFADYSDLAAGFVLPSLGCEISLAEIYDSIDFTAEP